MATQKNKLSNPADTVIAFLNRKDPTGLWVLTAIVPDGATITKTFKNDQPRGLRAFIDHHDGKRNLYYSLAQPMKSATQRFFPAWIFPGLSKRASFE